MKQNLFNKLWLRVGMLVAIMTTALSGTVWADTSTLTFTAASGGSGTADDDVAWTVTSDASESNFDNTKGIHYGTGKVAVSYLTLTTSGISGTITQIKVNASGASSTAAKLNVTVGGVAFGSEQSITSSADTYTLTGSASGTIVVSLTQLSAKKALYVKSIEVTYTPSGSSAVATTTTIIASGITNTDVYKSTVAGSLSASVTAGGSAVAGATVSWSSSNTDVAAIASDGTVTLVSAGPVTFTASYAGVSGEYQASSATYEMTVTSSAPDYTTLPFEWAGGTPTNFAAQAGCSVSGADVYSNQETYQIKLDGTGDYIQVKTDSQPGKVTIGVKMIGGATASSITVQESADGETFTNVETLAISGSQNNVLTLETTNDFAAASRYVRLYFTKGSNVGVGPISIALPSTDPVISAEDASIDYNTTSGSIDYEITRPVEGGTISASTDAAWLTFGSTGTEFTATVNDVASARVANVTLTYTYNTSQTVTKEITLTQGGDPNAPGTENNPYTVAQARAAIDAGTGVTGVYATGIVSEIVTAYNSQYGNISYNISADGLTTSDQLEIYRGKSFNGDNFTSENDIQVGDEVVVYGNLTTHGETYEFAQDNQLVSLTRAKQDPTIPSTPVSVVYGSTHTVTGIAAGEATLTSSNTAVATVEGLVIKPVAVGTTTITVTTAENTYYNAGSGTFELTVNRPDGETTAPTGSAGAVLFNETFDNFTGTSYTGGHDGEYTGSVGTGSTTTNKPDEEGWEDMSNYGADQCLKLGTGSAYKAVTTRSIALTGNGTLTFSAAGWGDSNANQLNVTASGATLSGDIDITLTNGAWDDYTVNITNGNGNVQITFSMKRGFLDDVKIEAPASGAPTETYTIPSSGLGTYCSQYPINLDELPEGVKAYAVTAKGESSVTLTEITGTIKGGVGFILEGSGEVTFTFADSSTEPTNLLVGTLAPEYLAAGTAYGLKSGVFQPNTDGTIKAHRAYLPADAGHAVKALTLIFEDDATGITHTRVITDEATIYDLTGRRLSQMQKGINIVNGKKILY